MRKRGGTLIMLAGVALALVAGLMVLSITRRAAAETTAQVKQVLVVMAARDIPEGTAISADALTVQAFPDGFVPLGAIPAPEQAVGKYTVTRLTKGQIVLANQLSVNKRAGNLALSVPAGKVAVALPMTDLMSTAGAIKPGDRVDILLTLDLKEMQVKNPQAASAAGGAAPSGPANDSGKNPVTQTTLQNVEILALGEAEDGGSSSSSSASSAKKTPAVIVLLDHQDAIVLKYAKDSGGVVDLALRAPEDTVQVKTEAMTIDLLFERFGFRRPLPVP
ncbi:MAG TPA: Flp pilus assembly protein CpaB [Herpetosiphonaceae bacterium]|nr:Flp pilus assembly protein CpaB [Herpetosiphonaceae bacterium]